MLSRLGESEKLAKKTGLSTTSSRNYPELQLDNTKDRSESVKNSERSSILTEQDATSAKLTHGSYQYRQPQSLLHKSFKTEHEYRGSAMTFQEPFLEYIDNKTRFQQHTSKLIERIKRIPNNLSELDLSNNRIGPDGISLLRANLTVKTVKTLNLSNNPIGDIGIQLLVADSEFKQLENLDLTKTYFEEVGSRYISQNSVTKNLVSLNLSENQFGNRGIKFIAEGSYWRRLEVLKLANIGLDEHGLKYLAENESWESLKELNLNDNSMLGDYGVAYLKQNKSWANIKVISVWGCNVRKVGYEHIRRNKVWKKPEILPASQADSNANDASDREQTTLKTQNSENLSKMSLNKTCDKHSKNKGKIFALTRRTQKMTKNFGRGGGSVDAEDFLGLLGKLHAYSKRILDEYDLQKQFRYYIQTRARNVSKDAEPFELAFELKAKFLSIDSEAKVLLITGESGAGKSMFCKYFQKNLLLDWNRQETAEDPENVAYLPIFMPLSLLKDPVKSAITETLSKELKLEQHEIQQLQMNAGSNSIPRVLFIFDGYEDICDYGFMSSLNNATSIFMNFYLSNKISEEWKEAKAIITWQEVASSSKKQKELIFAPTDKITERLIPNSLVQVKLERFSDEEIKSYLRKYAFFNKLRPITSFSGLLSIPQSPDFTSSESLSLKTWNIVEDYERAIDKLRIRDFLRTPYLLSAIVDLLPELIEMSKKYLSELENDGKGTIEESAKEQEILMRKSSAKSSEKGSDLEKMGLKTQAEHKFIDIKEIDEEKEEEKDDLIEEKKGDPIEEEKALPEQMHGEEHEGGNHQTQVENNLNQEEDNQD